MVGLVNLRCIDSNNKNYDFRYHRYDLDTNIFSNPDSTDNLNLSFFDAPIEANGFIQAKNLGFSFANADYSQKVSWGNLANWQELKCPNLKLMSDCFRLYVEDFHGSTQITSTTETINSLTVLNLYVYDLNTKQYMTLNDNLLGLSDLQQDENEKYYIDIPFDYLPYLHVNNGDFLIGVGSNLKSEYTLNGFSAVSADGGGRVVKANPQVTLFEDMSYWRYQYYSNSGTGLLVPTDAEGNPLDPDKPIPEPPDETQQKLEEQIKRLEEQTEAIKNQTQKIEEQTEVIKEGNETNKNIFQKIIELPRVNNSRFFRYA